jgi:hypothetical protein
MDEGTFDAPVGASVAGAAELRRGRRRRRPLARATRTTFHLRRGSSGRSRRLGRHLSMSDEARRSNSGVNKADATAREHQNDQPATQRGAEGRKQDNMRRRT